MVPLFFYKVKEYKSDVFFFNIKDHVVRACIDLLYGRDVTFPSKEKNRLTYLLSKLRIKWQELNENGT